MKSTFEIIGEYIELIKLLKAMGLAENGAAAKAIVEDGEVKVNSQVELRKRAKLHKGDIVNVGDNEITIE